MNIVTSICVDEDDSEKSIHYPATLGAKKEQRRKIYWKCVVVFFATSVRCNPLAQHILYTNDNGPVIINGRDIKRFLTGLGVDIRYLPFQYFKPPAGLSKAFRNAYYKLDVIKALSLEEGTYSVLLDSDCVWTKQTTEVADLLAADNVLLYDVYKSYLPSKNKHYQTRVDLGKLYKRIDADYPKSEPTQFGGEFIAASSDNLKVITQLLEAIFKKVVTATSRESMMINAENSIFDGDEFISSFVYNQMPLEYINAKNIIGRIWNALSYSNATAQNMELAIWHMPSEKTQGIPLLYEKVINPNSDFWKVPVSRFNIYLGKYLGVPRQIVQERYLMLTRKVFEAVKRKLVKV